MAKYKIELTDEQAKAIRELLGDNMEIKPAQEISDEFPEEGDLYWTMNSIGYIANTTYNMYRDDCKEAVSIGNCFRTREEAEFEVERLKVIHELKQFAEPDDDWGSNYHWSFNFHWTIYYNFNEMMVEIGYDTYLKHADIYFSTEEKAQEAIEAVGVDRVKKYYLRVNE